MAKTGKELQEESAEDLDVVSTIIKELKDIPPSRIAHILKTVATWYDCK